MSVPQSTTPLAARIGILFAITLAASAAWLVRDSLPVQMIAVIGVACFLGFAAAFSVNLRQVDWRTVLTGLGIQLFLGILILRVDVVYRLFEQLGAIVATFLTFANDGAEFVFGAVAKPDVAGKAFGDSNAVLFAFRVLPTIIFVASVFTVLYHLRVLQAIVWFFAQLMVLIFGKKGVSGAEALSATANVFMGQTEAPLIIKPYIAKMTQSELLAMMIGGMATISGGLIAVYIGFGADPVAVLATSVMAAPAGLYLAKILVPETGEPVTRGSVKLADERPHKNVIDAAAGGASDGLMLALNVAAMLIAFIAIVAMVNFGIQKVAPAWSLERIFAHIFAPVAFLMGVHPDDTLRVGTLLGKKLVLNEFVAFLDLTKTHAVMDDGKFVGVKDIHERSYKLTAFALTGFANLASIGIQVGGIGAMAPERRSELAALGMRALLGGFLATLINAAIAGIFLQ